MKKFLMVLLCVCTIFLCGCQTSPQYTLESDDKGRVTQTIYIPFSVSELVNMGVDGANATQIGINIKTTFDSYFLNRYDNFVTRLELDAGLTSDQKMMFLAYCPSREQMVGVGKMFETSDVAGITYEFKFGSAMAYYYFNLAMNYNDLVAELEKDNSIVKHNFLTTQKINSGESVFGQNTEYAETLTLAQYINKVSVETLTAEGSLTSEQIEQVVPKTFIYRYGTDKRRMHSNADVVRFVNDIYYHEWNIDLNNSDREIATWYTYANQNVWYGLALGLTLLLVAGLILYHHFKDKNKTKIEIIEPK